MTEYFRINTSIPLISNTHISQLPDFVAIQQLHSSRAFIEVVAKRDAAVPALDFTRARP